MAKVEIKAPIVQEISDAVNGAQSVVVVNYCGLTVAQDTALRKQMREAGVTYKVYKNTYMTRAFKGTEFEPLSQVLEGPSAIIVSKDDATAPARLLSQFVKKEKTKLLEVKGGIVEGSYYDTKGMAAIAEIPSREELLSKLLGSMQSPIANFARVIKQIAEQGGEVATAEAPAEAPAEEAPAAE